MNKLERRNKEKDLRKKWPWGTRFKSECSYAEDLYGYESSSSSDDPDYESIVDSDYELIDEDDEVMLEAKNLMMKTIIQMAFLV